MTDEEYQRIKEEEKKHLRVKKRLQRRLKALKQRNAVQSVKQGAARLLAETESLVDSLRRTIAQDEARFEVALDDELIEDEDLHEAEEELRDERAEELVRRMKAEEETSSRPRPSIDEADEPSDAAPEDEPGLDGPDKTIGRMGDLRPDDTS